MGNPHVHFQSNCQNLRKHPPASCLPDTRDTLGFPPSILSKPYPQKPIEKVIIETLNKILKKYIEANILADVKCDLPPYLKHCE